MKRRIILVLGCAAAVCGVLLYLLTPYTVAPQPEQLEIHQVRRVGSNTEYIDITAQTDTEALGQLLCKNRHPSPICMQFGHHPAGVSAPLSRSEAPMPYNWFSTAIL